MTSILTVVFTALSALLGSWVGAEAALRRFKRESTHRLQADWYGRAVRALLDLATAVREFESLVAAGSSLDDLNAASERIKDLSVSFGGQVSESMLYGSERAVKSIGEAASRGFTLAHIGPDALSDGEIVESAGLARRALVEAAIAVAEEGRLHLGLGAMPPISPLPLLPSTGSER